MKSENDKIIIENSHEVKMLKTVLEIASYGNFLTADERKIAHELSTILDAIYLSE